MYLVVDISLFENVYKIVGKESFSRPNYLLISLSKNVIVSFSFR